MKPGAELEGFIPSCSYNQGCVAELKSSAAWLWLPAAAMAVSLGVTLPARAAPYALPNSSGTEVDLSGGAYGGATSFIVNSGTVISNTGTAILGPAPTYWSLENHGAVTSTTGSAVYLYGGTIQNLGTGSVISGGNIGAGTGFYGTITNEGSITGGNVGVQLGAGTFTNSGTASYVGGGIGVGAYGYSTVILNEGRIVSNNGSSGIGVSLIGTSGTITNGGTGFTAAYIGGGATGIRLWGSDVAVVNHGTITGTDRGIYTRDGGSITNAGTSSAITGGNTGIWAKNFTTIFNEGSIVATGTASYSAGIYLKAGGEVTNYGVIQPTGTSSTYGIFLGASGTVHNYGSGARISGSFYGIKATDAATIVNTGSIASSGDVAISIYGEAHVTNSGTASSIRGNFDGIQAVSSATTILNAGYIGGDNGAGIRLSHGGAVTNSGTGSRITGYNYGIFSGAGALTIVNEGSITASYNAGVLLNSGTVAGVARLDLTNSGNASVISGGYYGVRSFGATTIVNEGQITGQYFGVYVYGGAGDTTLITNGGTSNSTATIQNTGSGDGIHLVTAGTIINSGIIQGGTNGIFLGAGGKVTNSGTGSVISGGYYGVRAADFATVHNEGYIYGGYAGVGLFNGGMVTNGGTANATASIYGGAYGVKFTGTAGTLTNFGRIGGGNFGVYLTAGGTVTNKAGGYIWGDTAGMIARYAAATVTNYGTIVSAGTGVILANGGQVSNLGTGSAIYAYTGILLTGSGTVTNQGLISGDYFGVRQLGIVNNITITNSGTIEACGCSGIGIALSGSGQVVTNSGASSLISGGYYGVAIRGQGSIHNEGTITAAIPVYFTDPATPGNNTVFNSGAITSTNGAGGVAVQFGAGDDRLILAQGYSFTGTVQGGAGTNTLEVFSGPASLAMLSNPEFVGFTQLQADAGATFSFGGTPVIPAGIGFINAGGITNTGTVTVHGTFTNIGTFTNTGSVIGDINGIVNSGGVLTNTGTITGTANDGVVLTGGTLNNTGLVQGGKYGVVVGAGASVFNSGTILDDAIAGASLGSGASLTNNAGNTISGVTGVVFTGTGASLTNFGTVTGSGGVAIQFDAGSNTATLGTGSVLNGSINGGGGAGQIVLTGTGSMANTVTAFGAGSGATVATGASWAASGSWTIATVTNTGTLQPGTAAAPLKLTGNFTQTGAGTFKAVLDGSGGSQLQVTGSAALDGTVLVVPPATLGAPTKYTLVTATGGVTGKFSSVSGGTALIGTDLSYDANDAFLTVTQRAVTSPLGVTETTNQLAVAGGFNAGLLANPAAFSVPLAQLNQLQAPAFITALDQMSGENIVDVSTSALLAQRQFIGQVMRQGRLSHGSDQEWSLWASGYAESGHLNGDGNAHRFNGGVSGMAAGLDYRVSESFRLGAAGGIGISHFNVAGGLGTGRMAYKQIAGTAGYDRGALYIDAMFGGAFGEGTTQRNIVLPGLVSSAAGHINSSQVMGSFEVGYGLSLEETISMTPFARLETGTVYQDGFSETGAGTLNLAAPAQSAGSTESLLGARFGTGVPVGTMLVSADVTLGWRHQLGGRGRTGRLSFAGVAGTDFTIAGASLMGDAADVGAGLSTAISDTGAAWVHYDGDYAGSGTSHAITVGLRFSW